MSLDFELKLQEQLTKLLGSYKSSILIRTLQILMYKLPIQKLQSSIYKQIFLII